VKRRPTIATKEIGMVSLLDRDAMFVPNAKTGTTHVVSNQKIVKPPAGSNMYTGVPSELSKEISGVVKRIEGGLYATRDHEYPSNLTALLNDRFTEFCR